MNLEFSVILSTYLTYLLYSKLQVPPGNPFVAISSLYDSFTSESQYILPHFTLLVRYNVIVLKREHTEDRREAHIKQC